MKKQRLLYHFLTLLIILLCISNLSAQSKNQFIKAANTAFENHDYFEAISHYKNVFKYDKNHKESHYKTGISYYELKDYKEAVKSLKKVKNDKDFLLANYYLGESEKANGNYTNAITYFKKFTIGYREDDYFFAKATQEIASCYWAKDNADGSDATNIIHLGKPINSRYSDFGATLFKDNTIQISTFQNTENNDEQNYRAWVNTYSINGDKLDANKNTAPDFLKNDSLDIANGFYLAEKDEFYFTACETEYTDSYEKRCDIYVSKFENATWSSPTPLNINQVAYTQTQPMVYIDDKGTTQLLFSSNREGGKGRLDIWQATETDFGKFDIPINLGTEINTKGDETTAFYLENDNTLYFSSNWHYGYGGFDIFKAEKENTTYSSAKNVGQPLNTSANDQYLYFSDDKNGYLSSNREDSYQLKGASCCFDIYNFDISECIPPPDTTIIVLDTVPTSSDTIPNTLVEMLPVTVYFHNDEPNPKTTSKYTSLSYEQCYTDYMKVKPEYFVTYSNTLALSSFFSEKVDKGWQNLDIYAQAVYEALQSKKIKLTIEGYCSPLALNDYNINLAHRRIVSLENYLLDWNNGILQSYYNSGYLQFENAPFGEETAPVGISDDYNNTTESIFNPKAAAERRVAIIAVEIK
ncbi:MAG: tetratricopeptide repeat protein [Chitinophagales bacterium]